MLHQAPTSLCHELFYALKGLLSSISGLMTQLTIDTLKICCDQLSMITQRHEVGTRGFTIVLLASLAALGKPRLDMQRSLANRLAFSRCPSILQMLIIKLMAPTVSASSVSLDHNLVPPPKVPFLFESTQSINIACIHALALLRYMFTSGGVAKIFQPSLPRCWASDAPIEQA